MRLASEDGLPLPPPGPGHDQVDGPAIPAVDKIPNYPLSDEVIVYPNGQTVFVEPRPLVAFRPIHQARVDRGISAMGSRGRHKTAI